MPGSSDWEARSIVPLKQSNVEALQGCLMDPCLRGSFWWFSKKLTPQLEVQDPLDCNATDSEFEECEILAKSVQFLEDGHVIFCLSTYEEIGNYEMKKEKELLSKLKAFVKSTLGYIGGSGSPQVESLAEFMVQIEEHEKHGHWMLREGTFQGHEMTAREFLSTAFHLHEDQCGSRASTVRIGHTETKIILTCDDQDYVFEFKEKTSTARSDHKYFSSSFDMDSNQ